MLIGQARSSDYWPRVCGSQRLLQGFTVMYLCILRILCGALDEEEVQVLEGMTGGVTGTVFQQQKRTVLRGILYYATSEM